MTARRYESWGRLRADQEAVALQHRVTGALPLPRNRSWLAFGNGRSYGDSCLNDGGMLIDTRGLDRFVSFDEESGRLVCESGVLLSEILELAVPRGWFLSVTPGTQYVTVGGAIANDVHGKNHHVGGTFGRHVLRFELLRSDGSRLLCSPQENGDLFAATIGGLGLTGVIQWAEIQLRAVSSPLLDTETIRFGSLDEFFSIATESDRSYEYTVAWIDCLARGQSRGRGLFMRGAHAGADRGDLRDVRPPPSIPFPLDPPISLVNRASLRAFNTLYYRRQRHASQRRLSHYRPFFYPLDRVTDWNRVYGRRGFFQFQCAVPHASAPAAVGEMLDQIAASGQGSFLAVLKLFGDVASPGLLSFPRPGATLALDFPNLGDKTHALLHRLERLTLDANGALYPAKDACMSPEAFRRSYPRLEEFERHLDPQFSSSFWRRVHG